MPKKTKKEKLIAEYRKKLKLLETQQTIVAATATERIRPQLKETKIISKPIMVIPSEQENQIKKFFIVDFKKSIMIIGFILALEISLYFVSMYSNLRLIK
jgi:hypothetical protein